MDKSNPSSTHNAVNVKTDAKPIPPPRKINLNYQSPYRNSPTYARFQRPSNLYALSTVTTNVAFNQSSTRKYTVKKTGKLYDSDGGIVPIYKTSSKNRGEVLIINNITFKDENLNREGAPVDGENLKNLFEDMGFNVLVERDLKAAAMESKIESFSKRKSLESADISILVVMSHGTTYGKERFGITEIFGTDGNGVLIEEILEKFSKENCKNMLNKPKIFIFQCCRGEREQVIERDTINRTSDHSDMLIAYSTIPGFVSYRYSDTGSWYIQLICQVFSQHAHELDVEDMLKIVDDKLSKMGKYDSIRQTSNYDNRGFKKCYFHPK